jgi:hypothetical protein
MALIKLQGNASGTGSLTVQAPNTNSDLTLGLPASNGTLVTTGDVGTVTNTMLARTGTAGQVLTSNGAGADPSYTTLPTSVTSAVAGNGVAVSAATGAVTFSAAAPTFNTVGSYVTGYYSTTSAVSSGQVFSAGSSGVRSSNTASGIYVTNNLSGTWRWMGAPAAADPCGGSLIVGVWVRVS